MRAGSNRGVGPAIVWGSFSMACQNSCYSHTGAEMRVTYESTGAVSRMQQVRELLKPMNAMPWSSTKGAERAGSAPKDEKCGSLASNLRYARLLSGFLPGFLRRNKTNPQQHRCQRPPTSVATFCEHLCQQNAARQFNRSEVSFNSRRRVAESKLGKQVRSHSL
jgi:hypothetical protein